jgi:hypothetical protein
MRRLARWTGLASQEYAVDYGCPRGQALDLRPMLVAVAAAYDGCHVCQEHHVQRIAADPALTAHAAGVALLTLSAPIHPVGLVNQVSAMRPACSPPKASRW